MKRVGLILILILAMGILPIRAQSSFIEVGGEFVTQYYTDSAGYDKLLKPDGSVLIYSQRYTVEYLSGQNWKQVTVPYSVTQDGDTVTRHYTDYIGTTVQVIYRVLEDGVTKADVVINSGVDRVYRVVWTLDGVTNNAVSYGDNWIQFDGEEEFVRADWGDAYNQYGDIAVPVVSDSANGKKLSVIFNVGLIGAGESLTLDPTLMTSYTAGGFSLLNIVDNHPSDSIYISAISQSFQIPGTTNRTLDSIKLQLWKFNNPTGNGYARIYTHSGVFGTSSVPGVLLASSDALNVASLGTTEDVYATLTFSGVNKITLDPTQYYVLTFEAPAAGTVDLTNRIRSNDRAAGIAGNYADYINGAWSANSLRDLGFYVYVDSWLTNDALDSDTLFTKDEPGWVNATVTDSELVANLATVDIQVNTTGDAETFTLRWTQATGVFSEVSDTSNICTLMAESVRVNIDTNTDKIAFNFNMTGGTEGACDVKVTSVNDDALTDVDVYLNEFIYTAFEWDPIADIIDSGFAYIGISNYITTATAAVTAVAAQFTSSITGLVTLINLQFQVIWRVFTWFTTWASNIVTYVLLFGTTLSSILNGIGTGTANIWEFFNFEELSGGFIVFMIVYWINSMGVRARTRGTLTVLMEDLNTFANVFAFFMGMFSTVIGFIEGRVGWIFQALGI